MRRGNGLGLGGWALIGLASLTGACLEKQPDSEITIGGSYGGVGGEGAASGPAKLGDVAAIPTGDGGGSAAHAEVVHEERPAGFGHDADPPPEGDGPPGGAPGPDGVAPPPEGDPNAGGGQPVGTPNPVVHEEHQHVDRPPGYGHDDGGEAAPAGAPGGSPDGSLPQATSPFERQGEGKAMVVVRGTLSVDGEAAGVADIDCFVPDETSPAKRRFVNKIKARAPGPFEMKVPAGYGPLILAAFLDLGGDGPDPTDPQGTYTKTLEVGDSDIAGVDIALGAGQPPPP